MIRKYFVWLHRWFGLFIAGFLIVEGLTGSLLAFNSSLTRLLNPKLFATRPTPDAKPLDLATLAEAAEAIDPNIRVAYFGTFEEGRVLLRCAGRKNPETDREFDLGFMYLVLDPYSGKELGRLRFHGYDIDGGIVENIIPFVFDLHTSLAGISYGSWILSVVALIWSIDCFIGFYLTLPVTRKKFFSRWKTSWLIKLCAGFFRANFDLHRAGGLWFWIPLFVFAWSSVQLIDTFGAYSNVMGIVFRTPSEWEWYGEFFPNRRVESPNLEWREAQSAGEKLMADRATKEGFKVIQPVGLNYFDGNGLYNYIVQTDRLFPHDREAIVFLDANTGELHGTMATYHPNPRIMVSNWLFALHNIKDPVKYLLYRILVAMTGLVTAMLSVTGIYIWWKKRCARKIAIIRRKHQVETRSSSKTSEVRTV